MNTDENHDVVILSGATDHPSSFVIPSRARDLIDKGKMLRASE